MIKTDRQLAIAKRKRDELLEACGHLEAEDAEVYRELARDLQKNIEAYVSVRDGQVNLFGVASVDDLAKAAVAARIARGWTQRDLAEVLGTSEQNVQKDEARNYEHVGLAKLAEIIEALGYNLVGTLRPVHLPRSQWSGPTGMRVGPAISNNAPTSAGASAVYATALIKELGPSSCIRFLNAGETVGAIHHGWQAGGASAVTKGVVSNEA